MVAILLLGSSIQDKVERRYTRLQNVIANIGGLISFVITLFNLISGFLSHKTLIFKLSSDLINFSNENEDIIASESKVNIIEFRQKPEVSVVKESNTINNTDNSFVRKKENSTINLSFKSKLKKSEITFCSYLKNNYLKSKKEICFIYDALQWHTINLKSIESIQKAISNINQMKNIFFKDYLNVFNLKMFEKEVIKDYENFIEEEKKAKVEKKDNIEETNFSENEFFMKQIDYFDKTMNMSSNISEKNLFKIY